MEFDSFASFVTMGGHGIYVWLSYAFWFVTVLGLCGQTWFSRRQALSVVVDYWEEVDANEQSA